MPRSWRLALAGLAATLVVLAGIWFLVLPRLGDRVADSFGHGDYVLQTTEGKTFTEASLKGAPSLVFFGYTHCPDVCPTTLGDIANWEDSLGEKAKRLRVYFVTVDPERDSAAMMKDYLSWLPGAVGVTGTRAEIDKAIKAFHVYARKVPGENGEYTYDHSAFIYLFNAQGEMTGPIGYGVPDKVALAALNKLLG